MGFDPCLVANEQDMFSEYSEVSVEFQLEDMNGNLLPLDLCQVVECGVRLLHVNDEDGLEAMFQAKRARFQGMGWDETGYVFPRRKKGRHN